MLSKVISIANSTLVLKCFLRSNYTCSHHYQIILHKSSDTWAVNPHTQTHRLPLVFLSWCAIRKQQSLMSSKILNPSIKSSAADHVIVLHEFQLPQWHPPDTCRCFHLSRKCNDFGGEKLFFETKKLASVQREIPTTIRCMQRRVRSSPAVMRRKWKTF